MLAQVGPLRFRWGVRTIRVRFSVVTSFFDHECEHGPNDGAIQTSWAKKLELIRQSGFTEFPPRLPEQPIFYPVLNEEYATQIARDWNAKRGQPKVGYVTRFHIRTEHLQRYQIQTVGGSIHQEYWIPAEELAEFNQNIAGTIEVIAKYRSTEEH